ncbi:MAG TPA: 2,3-bisphosphoglycerate-independent phosphoglycerate mutase [Actinobacteria bacterium]|nr:2,3-bisphosphoglycerate-independent phosphoglycerate mutase [Actinomycetota bacterium]
MTKRPKPVVLCILDGWGENPDLEGNAVEAADTPNLDHYKEVYPFSTLKASGEAVGLPEGQMGNSEVGHLNIGAGRVVYQEITRISKSIRNGDFFENAVLLEAFRGCTKDGRAVHLMGLLSDGGVHSHEEHLFALIDMAKMNGVERLYIHAFLDGRDVLPKSALEYFERLEKKMEDTGLGKVATVIGRYYAMDRDNRWDRVKMAYDAMVYAEGERAHTAAEAVTSSYDAARVDEFVMPTIIIDPELDAPVATVSSDDSVIFFNFRADRAREITRAFIKDDFDDFNRGPRPPKISYVCMTQYDADFDVPVAFPPQELTNVLADVLAGHGLRQLHVAETEKYAHVTFFFNGGEETPKVGEARVLIASPKVATYDLKPEMSADEVAAAVVHAIGSGEYDFIVVNFANGDMVGHTGVFEAALKAVATVDRCVGLIVEATRAAGGVLLITSDHGNADKMTDSGHDQPFTAHTTNKVPLYLITDEHVRLAGGGILADIAPTLLDILKIEKPTEMTGQSLIVRD